MLCLSHIILFIVHELFSPTLCCMQFVWATHGDEVVLLSVNVFYIKHWYVDCLIQLCCTCNISHVCVCLIIMQVSSSGVVYRCYKLVLFTCTKTSKVRIIPPFKPTSLYYLSLQFYFSWCVWVSSMVVHLMKNRSKVWVMPCVNQHT